VGTDWPQYRFDATGTGMNPERLITSANVGRLSARWTVHGVLGDDFLSAPAVVGDVVYANANGTLLAFDLHTGQLNWRSAPSGTNPAGGTTAGVAVDSTRQTAYFAAPDERVYAVHLSDGTRAWSTQIGDGMPGGFLWDTPLLANDTVYIGLSSVFDNPCVRGGVYALDPDTGAIRWMHPIAPAGTLGGGVWSSVTADAGRQEVIVTTGNPCPAGKTAAEEDAIVALDWTTGRTRWVYNTLTYDTCDCDFGVGAVNYTLGGHTYIVSASKYGMVYALSPSADDQYAQLAWAARVSGAGFLATGGVFEPLAYSDGIVFAAAGPTVDRGCPKGAVWGLQARTGVPLWRQCTTSQVVAGAAISGDVLFVAQSGALIAYQTTTGQVLWHAPNDGVAYGGVVVAHGTVIYGTGPGTLYCYSLPLA
jgi:outer membrane protein assembly factor BamB